MNSPYIGLAKNSGIPDMSHSFVDSRTEHAPKTLLLLTADLLKQLFHENYSFLCLTALKITEDEEAAKDIVQNFFLYCWEKKASLEVKENFKNYAYRAIHNASLNYQKRRARVDYDSDLVLEAAEQLQHASEAETQSLEEERERALWETIDLLPPKRKRIFLLSQQEGLTYGQIAAYLDISVNTVKTQIKLAYVFLRKEYQWVIVLLMSLLLIN